MLTDETLQQLQRVNFALLARQELNGQRRLRYIAHLKDGKNFTEVADALRVTRHSVMRWLKWFACGGVDRLAGTPHYWSTQRLPKAQEEAFRQAVEHLQDIHGGGRICGEDIRQLLFEQFAVAYSLNGVYDLLKRLDIDACLEMDIIPHVAQHTSGRRSAAQDEIVAAPGNATCRKKENALSKVLAGPGRLGEIRIQVT